MNLSNTVVNNSAANEKIKRKQFNEKISIKNVQNKRPKNLLGFIDQNKHENGRESSRASDESSNQTPENETDSKNRDQSSGSSFQSSNN